MYVLALWVCVCVCVLAFLICFLVAVKTVFYFSFLLFLCFEAFDLLAKAAKIVYVKNDLHLRSEPRLNVCVCVRVA